MRKRISAAAAAVCAVMTVMSFNPVSAARYGWQGVKGASAYIQADGLYSTGLVTIDGVTYRFGSDGGCMGAFTGFGISEGKRMYYIDGVPCRDRWMEFPTGVYYFGRDGAAATGITWINGKNYNFAANGKLITSDMSSGAFSMTASKQTVYSGSGDRIDFTIYANNINYTATMGSGIELHRYNGSDWVSVPQTVLSGDSVTDQLAALSYLGATPMGYVSSKTISFYPDSYSRKLPTGKYRAVITLMTDRGIVDESCEFDIIRSADVTTPSDVYYLNTATKIWFDITVSQNSMVYGPEIYELQRYDSANNRWIREDPFAEKDVIADSRPAAAGTRLRAYLDLTRYSRASMKTGTYRIKAGDDLYCEFELKQPFEASAVQIATKSKKNKQIKLSVANTSYEEITIKGYGELLRYDSSRSKWVNVPLKKGAKLDTKMEIPARHRWTKAMLLTDYYSLSSLKSGYYCVKLPSEYGGFVYAYFTLK